MDGLLPEVDLLLVAVGALAHADVARLAGRRRRDRHRQRRGDVGLARRQVVVGDRGLDRRAAREQLVDLDLLEREEATLQRRRERALDQLVALCGELVALGLLGRDELGVGVLVGRELGEVGVDVREPAVDRRDARDRAGAADRVDQRRLGVVGVEDDVDAADDLAAVARDDQVRAAELLRLDRHVLRLGRLDAEAGDREVDAADLAHQVGGVAAARRLDQTDDDLGALATQLGNGRLAGGDRVAELDVGVGRERARSDHAEHAELGGARLDDLRWRQRDRRVGHVADQPRHANLCLAGREVGGPQADRGDVEPALVDVAQQVRLALLLVVELAGHRVLRIEQ